MLDMIHVVQSTNAPTLSTRLLPSTGTSGSLQVSSSPRAPAWNVRSSPKLMTCVGMVAQHAVLTVCLASEGLMFQAAHLPETGWQDHGSHLGAS